MRKPYPVNAILDAIPDAIPDGISDVVLNAVLIAILIVLLPAGLSLGGCGKKNDGGNKAGGSKDTKTFEVKEVGVSIQAPADWEVQKRGSRWVVRGGSKGVFLRRRPGPAPKSAAEAVKRFADSKILKKEKLGSGGFYVLRSTKFPSADGGEPMWLEYVYVALPLDEGFAICEVQLTEKADKERYARICKSLKPLE